MTSPGTAGHPWTDWVWRAGLVLAALALALAVGAEFRDLQAAREGAFTWMAQSGIPLDTAPLDREPDPERVKLRAARAVLTAELDPARSRGLDPERAARESAGRMAAAAQASAEILLRRPASWEAAEELGVATYIGWAQAHDPRLFTRYRRWEAPLEAALRLAPARREPARFLAAAYLEVWPALSPRKRAVARGLLAEILRSSEDRSRFLEPWLDRASDLKEGLSLLPDDPAAWEQTAATLAQRGDFAGYGAARQKAVEELLTELERDLVTADRLRSTGALAEARALYLAVAQRVRPEVRFLPLLEQALERCPPGPVDGPTSAKLAPHLAQALDRCQWAGCQMEPAALKRLSRFVNGLEPPQEALAALYSGDLARASLYERRTQGLGTAAWAPYLLAKARLLATRDRGDEARETLSLVHLSWQPRPLYWQTAAEVARAAGDAPALAQAQTQLAALARRSWRTGDWTWNRGTARLEMVVAEPASALILGFDSLPPAGVVVELRLDGAGLGLFPLRAAVGVAPALRLTTPLGTGIHVLDVVEAQTNQVTPGTVELR
jgi:hypothetical protein